MRPYKNEVDICKDALQIVNGASNLSGVAHAMIEMVKWLHDAYGATEGHPDNRHVGGVHPDKHPAVRLVMSQLSVITGASPIGDVAGFDAAYRYCLNTVEADGVAQAAAKAYVEEVGKMQPDSTEDALRKEEPS